MTINLATLGLSSGQRDNGSRLNNATKKLDVRFLTISADQGRRVWDDESQMMLPISKMPNILDSFVEVQSDNLLMARHGIKKRNPSELHLVANPNSRAMIHYMDYVQVQLNNLIENPSAFWSFAILIAQRSSVFKSLMFREVLPHFHRDEKMKHLYLLINKYNLMWETLPVRLKYKRVYIPKSKDVFGKILKWRPLGVPTVAWRIFLHSWQVFLMIFLKDRISQHQHGFYKGRGTKTAWQEVLTKVIDAPDIYEFDLKGFFPSVNVGKTTHALKQLGLPDELSDWLFESSLSYPDPRTIDEEASKLDETNAIYKRELDLMNMLYSSKQEGYRQLSEEWYEEILPDGVYKGRVLTPLLDFIDTNGKELLIEYISQDLSKEVEYRVPVVERKPSIWDKDEDVIARLVKLLSPLSLEQILTDLQVNAGGNVNVYLNYLLSCDPKTNYIRSVLTTIRNARIVEQKFETRKHRLNYTRDYILNNWWSVLYEYWQVQSALFESFAPQRKDAPDPHPLGKEEPYKTVVESQVEGFPQGGPTSPILCSFILGSTVFAKAIGESKITMYADDGLFYGTLSGEESKTTELMNEYGISFALEKSGYIKQNGNWLKPLKYLGILYDPFANDGKGDLRAATRKGATLSFDKYKMIMELKARYLPIGLQNENYRLSIPEDHVIFHEEVESLTASRYMNMLVQRLKKMYYTFRDTSINFIEGYSEWLWYLKYSPDFLTLSQSGDNPVYYNYWLSHFDEFVNSINDANIIYMDDLVEEEFTWKSLASSPIFGNVQARLYNNSWNSHVEQDFSFTFKPGSWAWYAQSAMLDQTLSALVNPMNWETHFSDNLWSGRLVQEEIPKLSNRYFNQEIRRIYGYTYYESNPDTGKLETVFVKIKAKEFYRLWKTPDHVLSLEDLVRKCALTVKQYPKYQLDAVNFDFNGVHLTVFNSSSYAMPFLVNIFRIQNKLNNWKTLLSQIIKGKALSKALRMLRLGHSPETLYKNLVFNPRFLDHVPDPIIFSQRLPGKS